MSFFVIELWESIFTPGPTPVLLKATNATFATLQVLLLILLYGTHSIHFVALSIISGGLWWAINWFARELAIHQAVEAAKAKKQKAAEDAPESVPAPPSDADDDEDTEVDEPVARMTPAQQELKDKESEPVPEPAVVTVGDVPPVSAVQPVEPVGEMKKRVDVSGGHSGVYSGGHSGANTEDEWERVSEYEKDK